MLSKLAPAAIPTLATLLVWQQDWQHAGAALIGAIPAGLPTLGLSLSLEQLRNLLAPSLLIGFMVFLSVNPLP